MFLSKTPQYVCVYVSINYIHVRLYYYIMCYEAHRRIEIKKDEK